MKYTLVYREKPSGYNWYVRNNLGLYAAAKKCGNEFYLRCWRSANEAASYMEKCRASDLVWHEADWESKLAFKGVNVRPPGTTAEAYKPAHGGYPGQTDRHGTVTGRATSLSSFIKEADKPTPWWLTPSEEAEFSIPQAVLDDARNAVDAERLARPVRMRDLFTDYPF